MSGELCGSVGNLFRGIHVLSLDSKGRLAVPAGYRAELEAHSQARLIATISIDARCLWLYPWTCWQEVERQLLALPSLNRRARRLQRLLIGHAQEVTLDSQGRILLGAPLRRYADLSKSVVMIGLGDKFEIWDEEGWEAQRNVWMEEERLEDLAPSELDLLRL